MTQAERMSHILVTSETNQLLFDHCADSKTEQFTIKVSIPAVYAVLLSLFHQGDVHTVSFSHGTVAMHASV